MTHCEEARRRYLVFSILVFAISFTVGDIGCRRSHRFQGYNGKWWKNTPQDQLLGFIDGYVDGYTANPDKAETLQRPRSWYLASISDYYDQHSEDASMLVGQVLVRVADSAKTPAGGENRRIDGFVWQKYSNKERLGFVEGFLNALMPQTSRSVIFPRSSEYYANAITNFYRTGHMDQNFQNARNEILEKRIGEILWNMRNKGQQAAGAPNR
jgi:hypothetical protein